MQFFVIPRTFIIIIIIINIIIIIIIIIIIGFESNIEINTNRKQRKYVELIKCLESSYEEVSFVNLSIGAIGIFGKSCDSFINMLNDLNISKAQTSHICKSIANISARCTYYIFCRRNKDWKDVELLNF